MKIISHVFPPLGCAFILLIFSGCTVKATLDTTTDGTTEFLSSTSGQAWWTEDGLVREGQRARAFVANNHENLFPEMAKGNGEYLRAFGRMLGVTPADQDRFGQVVQANYAEFRPAPWSMDEQTLDHFLHRIQMLKASWESVSTTKDDLDEQNRSLMVRLVRGND